MLPTLDFAPGKLLPLATKIGICVPQPLKPTLQLQNENLKSDVSAARSFMNSSVNPSAESSNFSSDQAQTSVQAATGPDTPPKAPTETASNGTTANRQQPIPPPSEPMQYRAIGLVRGRYSASDEQFTQGTLVATDGTEITPSTGSDHEFGQESPEFRTTSVWSIHGATRRQVAPSDCWGLGARKAEQRFASYRETSARRRKSGVSSCSIGVRTPSSEIEDGYFSIRGESFTSLPQISTLLSKSSRLPAKILINQSISS